MLILSHIEAQFLAINTLLVDIEAKLDIMQKEQEACCLALPLLVAKKNGGDSVVGESYATWGGDSTNTYYPTVIFKFKEIEASLLDQRQVK